jgi:quercetin dioxygenase-like cupin family protein
MGVDQDISVAVERAEPGGWFPAHSHDLEQWFFVIEGSFWIAIDGEKHVLGPRSIVYVPRNAVHEGGNAGDGPLEYLVIDHWPHDSDNQLGF